LRRFALGLLAVLLCFGFLGFAFSVRLSRAVNGNDYTTPSGLVGCWNFDEGSGSIVNDASGYSSNGTVSGASWTNGKVWSALKFDGLDDYVDCGNNETLDPTQEATIEAWVKFDQLPSAAGHIMSIAGRSGGGTDLDVQAEGDNRFKFYIGPGILVSSSTVAQAGQWYYVAATYQGYDSTKIYVNGLLEATTSISGFGVRAPNSNSFSVGESLVWRGRYFNGTIDEVKLYNRTLLAEEIWAEYTRTFVSISHSFDIMDVGQSQQFNSSVDGGLLPYSYQWSLNDAAVSGAALTSWMFMPSAPGSHAIFLNVTDAAGASEVSDTVTVSVNEALSVSISPSSVIMSLNESQLFTAEVSGGTSPYFFQWYLNDTAIPGANGNTWTFAPGSISNLTVYVRVNDAVSSTAVPVEVGTVIVVPEFPAMLPPIMMLSIVSVLMLILAGRYKKRTSLYSA
jgi:hypothetical protein